MIEGVHRKAYLNLQNHSGASSWVRLSTAQLTPFRELLVSRAVVVPVEPELWVDVGFGFQGGQSGGETSFSEAWKPRNRSTILWLPCTRPTGPCAVKRAISPATHQPQKEGDSCNWMVFLWSIVFRALHEYSFKIQPQTTGPQLSFSRVRISR